MVLWPKVYPTSNGVSFTFGNTDGDSTYLVSKEIHSWATRDWFEHCEIDMAQKNKYF